MRILVIATSESLKVKNCGNTKIKTPPSSVFQAFNLLLGTKMFFSPLETTKLPQVASFEQRTLKPLVNVVSSETIDYFRVVQYYHYFTIFFLYKSTLLGIKQIKLDVDKSKECSQKNALYFTKQLYLKYFNCYTERKKRQC